MSKITQALEKAARERLQHTQAHATTTAQAVSIHIEPASGPGDVGDIAVADRIEVDPHIVAATDAQSPISEQYRILRTNLQSMRMSSGSPVIVVTSAVHAEGKSVTAINLALTLARQEKLRVVLVDGDLRKSAVHRWLGLGERAEGLSTALARGGELNGSLVRLQHPPLAVLPAGPHPEDPAELLGSSSMKRVLAALKRQFDLIVIDAPPTMLVTDPAILASQADGTLLVVRAGKTQRKTVARAHALLTQMHAKVVGCVLTHVEYYLPGYYQHYYAYRYGEKKEATSDKGQATSSKQQGTSDKKQVSGLGG
ncbi:MAG: hypothetical protein A3G88_01635 [Omnitrophica WOR_2 bacterium RIFCSPLOWO2_12_FULL_63_16]|nr:MAG: hypothetical protein A3G88_01635 [Omnitrophica WOR_2 bacterium RIFCSPLOWO2_12_FULL_63_16]